jgi:hypothetical protein
VTTLQAMLRTERAARLAAEADAQAQILLIEKLKLTIKKLRHGQFGQSSERGALLDQLELNSLIWKRMPRKPEPRRRWPKPARLGWRHSSAASRAPADAGAHATGAHCQSGAGELPMLW